MLTEPRSSLSRRLLIALLAAASHLHRSTHRWRSRRAARSAEKSGTGRK
jgi:hypothetical protein